MWPFGAPYSCKPCHVLHEKTRTQRNRISFFLFYVHRMSFSGDSSMTTFSKAQSSKAHLHLSFPSSHLSSFFSMLPPLLFRAPTLPLSSLPHLHLPPPPTSSPPLRASSFSLISSSRLSPPPRCSPFILSSYRPPGHNFFSPCFSPLPPSQALHT